MKPSILISGTIAATTTAFVRVTRDQLPATVFAAGLAGAEAVAVSLLAADVSEEDAAAGDLLALTSGGTAWTLDVDNNVLILSGPGHYHLSIDSSAGAVKIGVY